VLLFRPHTKNPEDDGEPTNLDKNMNSLDKMHNEEKHGLVDRTLMYFGVC